MAQYALETTDPEVKKAWEEKLYRETNKETYFSKFWGTNSDSLVHVKTDLEKDYGDEVTFTLRARLTGAGVEGEATLEGNEEAINTHTDSLSLQLYRHAVLDNGPLTRRRVGWSVDEEQAIALKDWGVEKIDSLQFTAVLDAPTRIAYLNSSGAPVTTTNAATAKAGLHATNSKLTIDFLSFLKTIAKTGLNRRINPIRPIMHEGRPYYIFLTHPDALYDLKVTSEYKQANREAMNRGDENPIFKGASAIFDSVVVHEHENMTIATDGGGASVAWVKSVLMGAQALCFGWGMRPELVEDTFDYGRKHGYAWEVICKSKKPVFNSLDFGSIGVYLSRTQVSDA